MPSRVLSRRWSELCVALPNIGHLVVVLEVLIYAGNDRTCVLLLPQFLSTGLALGLCDEIRAL